MDGINPVADFGLRIADYGRDSKLQSEIVDPLSNPVQRGEEEKKQLAKDFESVLLTKLFDQVKDSIGSWGLEEDEDGASDQVNGLFWLYLAQDVADKGGFGLWQDIYRHFQDIDAASVAGESIDREM